MSKQLRDSAPSKPRYGIGLSRLTCQIEVTPALANCRVAIPASQI